MFEPVDIPASRLLLLDDHTLVVESFKELLLKFCLPGALLIHLPPYLLPK